MGNSVNWGIIGNALIGRKCVMPAIARSRNGRIRALGTRRPGEAASIAQDNDIEIVYDSYGGVLEDPGVDAVYIPLPNHLHLHWTLKSLAAGKHVLCEKPLACSAAEAQQMAAAAGEHDRVLMEALMYRFHPRTQRIQTLITDGAIGRPRLVRAAFCFSMADETMDGRDNHRLRQPHGGGALLDIGCYGVSAARWFLGAEPVMVQAQAIFAAASGVDVHLVGNLRFANDTLATIEASFCSGLQQTYSVVGSEGVIDLPQDAFVPWEKDAVIYYRRESAETGDTIVVPGVDEYRLMVEHFGDQILDGVESLVPVSESIRNLSALDALAKAARSGDSVAPDIIIS